MKWTNILSGFIGASILVLVLLAITVWLKPFNYQVVYVVNSETVDKTDSLTSNQIAVLKDLENKGILLTPQEYTSHIASYYSTLVAFLIGLFVIFTLGSFFSIRNSSKSEIEEAKTKMKKDFEEAKEIIEKQLAEDLKNSKDFDKEITNVVRANMKENFLTKSDEILVGIDIKLKEIENQQTKLSEDIELIYEELELDSKSEVEE